MNKAFYNFQWWDYPSIDSPVNRQNLMKINNGLDETDNRVISLDSSKFDKSEAQLLIKDMTLDIQTGILTKYYYNGSIEEINTGISKLNMNLRFDAEDQMLYIVNADGTEDPVDLSVFITNYEFENSDTIAHNISGEKVKSIVRDGSIQEKHLQPNYLADIKVEVAKAQSSATAAATSETNAKASENAAKASENSAAESAENSATYANNAENSANTASSKATESANSAASAYTSATTATNKANAAYTSATNAANSENTATTKANAASASATNAASSAASAENYAKQAQSYAVGTGNARPNEANDNAKKYYEQAKEIYDNFNSAGNVTGVKGSAESNYRTGNVNITASNVGALSIGGDSKDNIVTFESGDVMNPTAPADVALITSGEAHKSLFNKLSTMARNVRYLLKMFGNIDISSIADGTVTGAINAINTGLFENVRSINIGVYDHNNITIDMSAKDIINKLQSGYMYMGRFINAGEYTFIANKNSANFAFLIIFSYILPPIYYRLNGGTFYKQVINGDIVEI